MLLGEIFLQAHCACPRPPAVCAVSRPGSPRLVFPGGSAVPCGAACSLSDASDAVSRHHFLGAVSFAARALVGALPGVAARCFLGLLPDGALRAVGAVVLVSSSARLAALPERTFPSRPSARLRARRAGRRGERTLFWADGRPSDLKPPLSAPYAGHLKLAAGAAATDPHPTPFTANRQFAPSAHTRAFEPAAGSWRGADPYRHSVWEL